jgi:hypothetical protein
MWVCEISCACGQNPERRFWLVCCGCGGLRCVGAAPAGLGAVAGAAAGQRVTGGRPIVGVPWKDRKLGHRAAYMRAYRARKAATPAPIEEGPPAAAPGFDRNAYHKAYMRDYMKAYRARKKAG